MANKTKFDIPFKKITAKDIKDYIETNYPQDKAWFKDVAFTNGKYNHLKAVRAFCEKYAPDLIPVAKEKAPKASDMFANW